MKNKAIVAFTIILMCFLKIITLINNSTEEGNFEDFFMSGNVTHNKIDDSHVLVNLHNKNEFQNFYNLAKLFSIDEYVIRTKITKDLTKYGYIDFEKDIDWYYIIVPINKDGELLAEKYFVDYYNVPDYDEYITIFICADEYEESEIKLENFTGRQFVVFDQAIRR